ncbi:MAG: TIGR03745 family integrating conjugative element membrane protein [Burkholderiales bacterium]|jgi:integrating conjugative element membrane protein (TIGR03745 family)|nr:TIGR03745 family integrating conjugative element membrane protein [Burkholderiales bacterium]
MSRLTSFFNRTAPRCWMPAAITTASALVASVAHAALPTNPTGVSTSGNYLENMRDYIGLAIGLVALVLAGWAFIAVSGGAIAKFNEWRVGKAELGDVKMVFIVGGLLLIVVIYLVTQAIGIIATSGAFANG